MKKILFVALATTSLMGISSVFAADNDDQFYVRVQGGASFHPKHKSNVKSLIKMQDPVPANYTVSGNKVKVTGKSAFRAGAAVGVNLAENFAAEFEYTYKSSVKYKTRDIFTGQQAGAQADPTKDATGAFGIKARTPLHFFMVNGLYKFDLDAAELRIGAGVGLAAGKMHFKPLEITKAADGKVDAVKKDLSDNMNATAALNTKSSKKISKFAVSVGAGVGFCVSDNLKIVPSYKYTFVGKQKKISLNSHDLMLGLEVSF